MYIEREKCALKTITGRCNAKGFCLACSYDRLLLQALGGADLAVSHLEGHYLV